MGLIKQVNVGITFISMYKHINDADKTSSQMELIKQVSSVYHYKFSEQLKILCKLTLIDVSFVNI